jgi:PAS domain S-box-containing protein
MGIGQEFLEGKKDMSKKTATSTRKIKGVEETIHAVREGSGDAYGGKEPEGHRVYSLEGADLPYGVLVERMQQGAAILNKQGEIIYCNPSLAALLGVEPATLIGLPLKDIFDPPDWPLCEKLASETQAGPTEGEMRLRRQDGSLISAHFDFRLLSRNRSATGVLITDLTAREQHTELAFRLQRLQDDERRRIARDLHDSVGQLLVAIAINGATIKKETHKLSPEGARAIEENAAMIDEIGKGIRTISHLLHPPLLDEVGLPSALRWYIDGFAERSNIQATLDIPQNLPRLPQEIEIAIFRAVQECLTNVHRHSGSDACVVKIVRDEHKVCVEVNDSGRGIPKQTQEDTMSSGGVGIRGLQERMRLLGGSLEISSSEKGTTVTSILPMPGAQRSALRENVA